MSLKYRRTLMPNAEKEAVRPHSRRFRATQRDFHAALGVADAVLRGLRLGLCCRLQGPGDRPVAMGLFLDSRWEKLLRGIPPRSISALLKM